MSMSKFARKEDHWKDRAIKAEDALQTARDMIRGTPLEHAIVDLKRPDEGLGKYLDKVMRREC